MVLLVGGYREFILAVDVGTTKVKVGLVDPQGFRVVGKVVEDAVVETPRHGWAEVDAELLWDRLCMLSSSIVFEGGGRVLGVVFSGHMAGVVPVDKEGNPLRKLIIWLDERAAGYPRGLWSGFPRVKGYNAFMLLEFLRITGGAPGRTGKDPISKILWVRENEPDVWGKTFKVLGTNSFLIAKATGSYVVSPDDASLTWLVDTRGFDFKWHPRLLRRFGLNVDMFPKIMKSTDIAGLLRRDAAECLGLSEGIPVVVGSGDMTSAAIGSGAVEENEIHIYIGTSDWVAAHVARRKLDLFNYIGSIPSGIPGYYLLVAEQEIAGGALDKVLEIIGMKGEYEGALKMAEESGVGARGLLFMPWLYGERAPIDDPNIRGSIVNLSLIHGRGDVVRAVLEGVALNIKWVYGLVERMTRVQEHVNIVGGGAQSNLWCQIVSNAINRVVRRIADPQDATLRGASVIASVALGLTSFRDATSRFEVDRVFKPDRRAVEYYEKLFKSYVKAYKVLKELISGIPSLEHDLVNNFY
jgi:xylulokinase